MTSLNEQTTLETKAEEFLNIKGVHHNCWVRRLRDTLRTQHEEYKAQGNELAVKHMNQTENLLLKEIKESLDHLEFFRTHASEILGSIEAGEVFTHLDWGNGWQWKVQVIRVDGTLVKVGDGGFAIYQGQNTKPLVTKDFLLSSVGSLDQLV